MATGQFLGSKKVYEYTNEGGTKYLLQIDETLGDIAGCGLTEASTSSTAMSPPKRFKPRIVYWQGYLGGKLVRKSLICGTSSATLYSKLTSTNLTIDGVAGYTTGRRGEKLSFLALKPAT